MVLAQNLWCVSGGGLSLQWPVREVDFSADVVRLLSGRKVRQHRRKEGKQADARLYKLWKQFREGEITVRDLLKSVAGVAGPVDS